MSSELLKLLKARLKKFHPDDIVFSNHSRIQASVRQIDLSEVKQNLTNPKRLVYAKKEAGRRKGETKYDTYFAYAPSYAHRYIFTMNGKIVVVTVIKIQRNWQKLVEWYEKIRS